MELTVSCSSLAKRVLCNFTLTSLETFLAQNIFHFVNLFFPSLGNSSIFSPFPLTCRCLSPTHPVSSLFSSAFTLESQCTNIYIHYIYIYLKRSEDKGEWNRSSERSQKGKGGGFCSLVIGIQKEQAVSHVFIF